MEDETVPDENESLGVSGSHPRKGALKKVVLGLLVFCAAVQLSTAFFAALLMNRELRILTAPGCVVFLEVVYFLSRYSWILKVVLAGGGLLAASCVSWLLFKPSRSRKLMIGVVLGGVALGFLNGWTHPVCGDLRGSATVLRHARRGYVCVYKTQFGLVCWPRWVRTYVWSQEPIPNGTAWSGTFEFSKEEFLREQALARSTFKRMWRDSEGLVEDFDGWSIRWDNGTRLEIDSEGSVGNPNESGAPPPPDE